MLSVFTRSGRHAAAAAAVALALLLGSPAAGAQQTHTVSKGQTLGKIARRYRTTVDAIREVNALRPGQRIHPGLVLVIPERGKEAEATRKATALRKEKEAPAKDDGKAADQGDRKKKAAPPSAEGKAKADGKAKEERWARKPKRPGFVRMVRGTELLEAQVLTRKGRLLPGALPKLSQLLRAGSGASIAIDPRLATLIGMVSDHFGGRTIRVVSGYRPYSPAQYTPHSNHNVGRAMDFMVEGVPNTVVRDFCRTFRNAGVGYYPNSTFVHLDVRSGKVHWVDYSRPGEPPRYDGTGGSGTPDEAARDVGPIAAGGPDEEVEGSKFTPTPSTQPINSTNGNPGVGPSDPETLGDAGKNLPPSSVPPPK